VRTPGHKTILLALVALVTLALVGCGGGGEETTESTPAVTTEEPAAPTKAELIEEGDDVCAEVNAAVGALSGETAEVAVPQTIEQTANLYTGMVERLQDLGVPENDDDSYAKFMEAAEELAKVEGEVKLAAEREDTVALGEAATEAAPTLEEFQTQAEIYGFEECSEGPGAPTAAGPGGEVGTAPAEEEFEGGEEEGGVEVEPEYVEPELEEEAAPEEPAPETGGAGGGAEAAPEAAPESGGGSESGGVGPG
jgi:hypothetical protein